MRATKPLNGAVLKYGPVRAVGVGLAPLHLWLVWSFLHLTRLTGYRGLGFFTRTIKSFLPRNKNMTHVVIEHDCIFSYPTYDEYWPHWMLRKRNYEIALERFLFGLKSYDYCFIDCGANFGYWSIIVSGKKFGAHKSVAIEASRTNFAVLEANARINGERFSCLNRAVAASSAERLRFSPGIFHNSGHIVWDEAGANDRADFIEVPGVTLDEIKRNYFSETESFVVKLDVEGAEIAAFKGGESLDSAVFVYEDHGRDKASEVSTYLFSKHFEIYFPHDDGSLEPITTIERICEIKVDPNTGYNFVAICGENTLTKAVRAMI